MTRAHANAGDAQRPNRRHQPRFDKRPHATLAPLLKELEGDRQSDRLIARDSAAASTLHTQSNRHSPFWDNEKAVGSGARNRRLAGLQKNIGLLVLKSDFGPESPWPNWNKLQKA